MNTYLKALAAFAGALCTSLGTAALTGGISLSEALLAVGGTIATSGLVASATNKPKG